MDLAYLSAAIDNGQHDWAEYSKLPPPQIILNREDDKRGHRFYWWITLDEDKPIVSTGIGITSLLSMLIPKGNFLIEWMLKTPNWETMLNAAADYGTLMHLVALHWFRDKKIPEKLIEEMSNMCHVHGVNTDMPQKDALAIMKFQEDYNVEPLLMEAMLVGPPIGVVQKHYCLTLDLFCALDHPKFGRVSGLVDFKSNFMGKVSKTFYDSHLYQLIGAKEAMRYNYPDVNVDFVANWAPNAWTKSPTYTLKFWDYGDDEENIFNSYMNIAYIKDLFTPTGQKLVTNIITKDTPSSDDYELMDYVSYIKKYKL